MPIQVLSRLDGGTATPGARTATAGQTVQLQLADYGHPVVLTTLYEIYSFPPDWPLPSGWTANAAGDVYYALTVASALPPAFPLPSSPTWGKWLFRATVNDGLTDGSFDRALIATCAVRIFGPGGLHGVAAHEGNEFDVNRHWAGEVQRDLVILGAGAGGGVASIDNGGTPRTGAITLQHGTGIAIGNFVDNVFTISFGGFDLQQQGSFPMYSGSDWTTKQPGTAGYVLTSGGPGADLVWAAPAAGLSGSGFVTVTGGTPNAGRALALSDIPRGSTAGYYLQANGSGLDASWAPFALTNSAISNSAGIAVSKLANGAAGQFLFNDASLIPTWTAPTAGDGTAWSTGGATLQVNLSLSGQAQGALPMRGASAWGALLPGAAGYVLASGGTGADLTWVQRTQPQSTTPAAVAATGAVGTGTTYARDDHAHAGVAKINTLTGDITLAASGNLTLTPSGNTLTLGASAPTGTGFAHYVSGVRDSAAKLVTDSDVDPAAAIAVTKIAPAGTNGFVLQTVAGVPTWAAAAYTSINALSGALTLAAGTNVSLGTSGSTITVNATAPTGTGFSHITAGARDAAAQLVFNADVDPSAAIAVAKLAAGTVGQILSNNNTTVPFWITPTAVGDGIALTSGATLFKVDLSVASQANGDSLVRVGGAWVRQPGPAVQGQTLRAAGSGVASVWGIPSELATASVTASLTPGANVDTTLYTSPAASTAKVVVTSVFAVVTTALVGSGSVTFEVGITAGGIEMLKAITITSADVVRGRVFGLSITTEAGTSMLQDNGSAYDIPASTPIVARVTTTGTVTTAPVIKFYVGGMPFA